MSWSLCVYFGLFIVFGARVEVQSISIISIYDEIGEGFEYQALLSSVELIHPIKVYLYTYIHRDTKTCIKAVSYELTIGEDSLDFFLVSCDLQGPFSMDHHVLNIHDIAHLVVVEHEDIWAIYIMNDGTCIQRRYTDNRWMFLPEIEEMLLTSEQCAKVLSRREPLQAKKETSDHNSDIPALGQNKIHVIALDDSYIENYQSTGTQDEEGVGEYVKLTVVTQMHVITNECVKFVCIDTLYSEDLLDTVVTNCDKAEFTQGDNMIVYGGAIYVRDHAHDPIWAFFVMDDMTCLMRVYTTDEHEQLEPHNERKLSWDQCKQLLATKRVAQFVDRDQMYNRGSVVSEDPQVLLDRVHNAIIMSPPPLEIVSTSSSRSRPLGAEAPGLQPVPLPPPPIRLPYQPVLKNISPIRKDFKTQQEESQDMTQGQGTTATEVTTGPSHIPSV